MHPRTLPLARLRYRILIQTGWLLALAGCKMLPPGLLPPGLMPTGLLPPGLLPPDREAKQDAAAQPSRVTGVGVDSDGLVLGEADGVAFSPDQLLASVSSHLAEKRNATARREVQSYPDVAWQLLRGPVPAADATALRAVAAAHDAQCVRGGDAASWQTLLADRAQRPGPYQRYAQRRAAFLADVRQGLPRQALATELVPPAGDQLPKLVAICDSSDPQVRCAALATLGSLRLTNGSTKQGYQLLHRALEQAETVDWPARAQAEADFGLAHLLLGNESAGLDWLHRAQARFEATGDLDDLLQSLDNELAYVEQAKKKSEAQTLRQRIERLQL